MEPMAGAARHRGMRPRFALLLAAMAGLPLLPIGSSPAVASCAAPTLQVERPELQRGTRGVVRGAGFNDGCADTGSCTAGLGCSSCEYEEVEPLTDVELRLRQGGRTWLLDSADAAGTDGRQGDVRWRFAVPPGAGPGPAQLVTDRGEPLQVRLR